MVDTTSAQKVCHIREKVAGRIGEGRFQTWFKAPTEFSLEGERLQIMVENPLVGTWITANFLPHLIEATREVIGAEPSIDVQVVQQGSPETAAPWSAPPRHDLLPPRRTTSPHRAATLTERPLSLRGQLESFVVGPSNQLAYSAASAIVRRPGADFRLLVLHGGCGLGKTHLMHGICNGVRREHPDLEWRFVSGEQFTNEFVCAIKTGRIDAFRTRFRQVDVLLVDDIHFLANKKGTQDEFLHTFDAIDGCGKAVILASDRHPRTIATFSEPLISRLIAGMVVEIDPPDFETRRKILARRVVNMNVQVTDEVLDFLARRIERNVRELEGALHKLAAMAALAKRPADLEMARLAVSDRGDRVPEPEDIEQVVAAYFGLSCDAIRSDARDRTISLARALTMYLIREHTRMSYPEIGRALGNKNHSTVLMAVRRIQKLQQRNGAVAWRTPAGPQESPLSQLLAELERQLARGPGRRP
jgi:chromosomal replication initiator protein